MMISCFFMQAKLVFSVSLYEFVNLTLCLFPSLHQLSLRMSKPPVLMAVRWAEPMSHGGHRSPPSLSPRSATGCSKAPLGRITAARTSCRECWELRRMAARAPISRHLLPVLLQTTWDPQGEPRHGRSACTCPRLVSRSLN